jgi:hypothetical protein
MIGRGEKMILWSGEDLKSGSFLHWRKFLLSSPVDYVGVFKEIVDLCFRGWRKSEEGGGPVPTEPSSLCSIKAWFDVPKAALAYVKDNDSKCEHVISDTPGESRESRLQSVLQVCNFMHVMDAIDGNSSKR